MSSEWTNWSDGAQFNPGDRLPSPQRVYYCTLEGNGVFNIYRGDPNDPAAKDLAWSNNASLPSGWHNPRMMIRFSPWDNSRKDLTAYASDATNLQKLWSSGYSSDTKSPMTATLGDDGHFALIQNDKEIWSNGFSDPLVEYIIDACDYDTDHIKRGKVNDKGAVEQELSNNSGEKQSMTMSKTVTTTVTSGWSNTLGLKTTLTAKVQAGVPLVSSAEVSVSAEVSNAYTWSGSSSSSMAITISIPIVVPPHKKYRGVAFLQEVEFEIPYTMRGQFHFKSGKKVSRTIKGTYKGANSFAARYQVDDITDKNALKSVLQEGAIPRAA